MIPENTATGVSRQQIKRQQREKTKALKHKVFELELNNKSHLYIYRYSDDWWRMGGNSALFYYHLISKQLNTSPSLSLDRDYYDVWKTGVISIRNIDQLLDKCKRAGFSFTRKPNLVVIKLQKSLTITEVKTIQNIEAAKEKEFNRITIPKLMYPGINAKLRELTEPITETLIKLNTTRYKIYGHEGAEICWNLRRQFTSMTNGRIAVTEYFEQAIAELDQLSDWFATTRDYHIFNNDANLRHINNIVNLRKRMVKELNTIRHKEKPSSPQITNTTQNKKSTNKNTNTKQSSLF